MEDCTKKVIEDNLQRKKCKTVEIQAVIPKIIVRKVDTDHRMASCNRALEITRCESIETKLCTKRLLWAGALIQMSDGRLPK